MVNQSDQQFEQNLQRIERLVAESDQAADPSGRETIRELVRALFELHATGLARLVDLVSRGGESGRAILNSWAQDDLVKPLLLLYGLHPLSLEERVRQAVERIRPSLGVHGAVAEIQSIEAGLVQVHIERNGKGHGHGAVAKALRQAVEEAVHEAAPDVVDIEITGLETDVDPGWSGFIPLAEVKGMNGKTADKSVREEVVR